MSLRSSFWIAITMTCCAALASCDVGDAHCTDKTVEEDRNDDCPYGPPGGPQRQRAEQCEVVFDTSSCTKTWRDDVFPILVRSYVGLDSGGGCTLQACHGPNGTGRGDLIVSEFPTPDELYAALARKVNDAGDPYIEANNPNAYFICNLEAKIGGGSAMPPNAGLTDSPSTSTDDDDLETIREWVECGMLLNGGDTGGAGGGG